ncbi:MAG: response regulator [Patescibacteria group bacterium]
MINNVPQTPRVLVIDGDRFYADILQNRLGGSGFEVRVATTGECGIEQAQDWLPDMILLAIKLPKADGFQILEDLKTTKHVRKIPVAMLTELGSREDVCHCFDHGATQYFIKAHNMPEDIAEHLRLVFSA